MRFMFLTTSVLVFASHAIAAPSILLDRQHAIALALDNNRALRGALASLGIARGQLLQARVLANPEAHVEARVPTDGNHPITWEIHSAWNLSDVIVRGQRTNVASAEVEARRFAIAEATLALRYDVERAWLRWAGAQQQLLLWQRTATAWQASAAVAATLFDAGNVPQLDVVTEQAAYEEARVHVTEAELAVLDAKEALTVLLGLSSSTDLGIDMHGALVEPLAPPLTRADNEALAIEHSLDLAARRETMRANTSRLELAHTSGWLPPIALGISAQNERREWAVGPELHIALPVSDQARGTTRSLRAELDTQRDLYAQRELEIRAEVRRLQNRVDAAQRRATQLRDAVLPLRQRALAETLLQYNAMHASVFVLLEARRAVIETERQYGVALLEHWLARAALDNVIAGGRREQEVQP